MVAALTILQASSQDSLLQTRARVAAVARRCDHVRCTDAAIHFVRVDDTVPGDSCCGRDVAVSTIRYAPRKDRVLQLGAADTRDAERSPDHLAGAIDGAFVEDDAHISLVASAAITGAGVYDSLLECGARLWPLWLACRRCSGCGTHRPASRAAVI